MSKSDTQIAVEEISKLYEFQYPYVIPVKTSNGRPVKERYIPKLSNTGYPAISFRRRKLGLTMKVHVHQVVAYQKYGDKIFEAGILCRHLDNNKLNFSSENIEIGTALDNSRDNSPEIREKIIHYSKEAAKKLRKFNQEEVIQIRNKYKNGITLKALSLEYGVAKSTMSYICRGKTYAEF